MALRTDLKQKMISEIDGNKNYISVEIELQYQPDLIHLLREEINYIGQRFYYKSKDFKLEMCGIGYLLEARYSHLEHDEIYEYWQNIKEQLNTVIMHDDKHHLKFFGGFQFSEHSLTNEWKDYGMSHFVLPKFLITKENGRCYLTYTDDNNKFDIENIERILNAIDSKAQTGVLSEPSVVENKDIQSEEWKDLVTKVVSLMNESVALQKVVLSRRRKIEFEDDVNVEDALQRSLDSNESSYLLLFESGKSQFISQTPEQLCQIDNGKLYTNAIAGTIIRTEDESENNKLKAELLNDSKNQFEHRYVVDSIIHDIQSFTKQLEYDKKPTILTNKHLYHLYTKIQADLLSENVLEIVNQLHPTPALGGFPKVEAIKFIEHEEFGTRGFYGAPLGYIDLDNNGEFVVSIRSMLVRGNAATLYSGCGIVKDSNAISEFEETDLKFKPMLKALGVM
ncbi:MULTISPECIES: isochorismate synthase [Mammaliicoccus]|uniref:isochorismate synthase n=1 Tax=Mammaliicoccus fleurettii TaxID=150056 RepID=A0ABS5MKK2_9STAP|nr:MULTISPECIES: isochorismate synthase [Mammaliicoccus]MBL0847478.1 isochorismate synthase [Mammaliicoccus fleurettii]MBS3671645.1 isochorismate synthase [Mammaliicoccus fleurettii]MBS3696204.1 isochorismate synthase [Mammaliicoccus fleurettii]MBW0764794.1 isochorismate synthase [Mammaliicoccus fleurettii]